MFIDFFWWIIFCYRIYYKVDFLNKLFNFISLNINVENVVFNIIIIVLSFVWCEVFLVYFCLCFIYNKMNLNVIVVNEINN